MSTVNIANGPWLLAPTPHTITIVWEMEQPEKLQLVYQTVNGKQYCITPEQEREPDCPDNPAGYCLYTAVLSDLQPETEYEYAVCAEDGELLRASFTTLAENPERIRCVTVSDSHLFYTNEAFKQMLREQRPELLLHGGDISFGTGYQHEQYVNNWFARLPEELRRLPAYHIVGNHDDGPFYDLLFASRQAKTVNSPDGGFTFSFDYGPAHIVMVNSNPWGLFEMNAVNSGQVADDSLRQQIRNTLEWIEGDLRSEAAQKASWRVLITHHPYTDIFNNRYIVPLAERCGVDLVIGGHLHYYIKSVSVDPEVGARTVYVCQGSTQDPMAEFDVGGDDKRLLGDFPEVVAMGNSNYGILEATSEELLYKIYGFQSGQPDKLVDTVRITHAAPQVEVLAPSIRCLNGSGLVEIRAVAWNTGEGLATVVLPVEDDGVRHEINLFGEPEESRVVLLQPKERRQIVAYYQPRGEWRHKISVLGAEQDVDIIDAPQITYEHQRAFIGEGTEADCLTISAEAINHLYKTLTVDVSLHINTDLVETKRITFRPHERRCVEFSYHFQRAGEYKVSLGGLPPKTVYVEGGIQAVPRIADRSGHGHDALLHGSPRVITEQGKTVIYLDNYGDYIEIPANPDLVAKEGFTGVVSAKVERLAEPDEMSHNPLMVRGKSVGWGATYFMRMVIERQGGLKWGTCHGITEYSWQGGEAAVGRWAQYTLSFDKTQGGVSYVDDEAVAHIAGIDGEVQLRQWDTEPIFVGYSYIGHVIPELGRPKYYTHLPAAISQVRFYKRGLTAAENQQIGQSPDQLGPQQEALAVWLDLDNIANTGQHITEWRHPAVYCQEYLAEKKYWKYQTLKAQVKVPVGSSLRAVVEVSDDETSIKGRLEIVLRDGENVIDLTILPQAQFLRITTDFSAAVGSKGVFAPVVESYEVATTNGVDESTMVWSTRPSWEKGRMLGAIGFESPDRLREFPEYTDVIHG